MPVVVRVTPAPGGGILIQFPYDMQTVAVVKAIAGTRWDKRAGAWTGQRDVLPALQHYLGRFLKVDPTVARPTSPKIDLSKFKLYPYQEEATRFLLERADDGGLIGSDAGVGKTCSEIAWACTLQDREPGSRVLVVYPNVAKGVWRRELRRLGGGKLVTCEGQVHRYLALDTEPLDNDPATALAALPADAWIGCHYEILKDWEDDLRRAAPRILICDEAHKVTGRKTQRADSLLAISTDTVVHRSGASGTLMRSGVKNLWSVCEIVRPGCFGGHWGNGQYEGRYVGYWNGFARRYCGEGASHPDEWGGYDDTGSSNEEELAARLTDLVIRHRREDVLPHLPKLRREMVQIELQDKDRAQYEKTAERLIKRAEATHGTGRQEILDQLLSLVDGKKLPTAVELAREALDSHQKVVVFTHFHKSLEQLQDAFTDRDGKLEPGVFVAPGWISPDEREPIYDAFYKYRGPAVLLGNTLSSGVAINQLACASRLICTTLEWLMDDLIQMEGRLNRIGQLNKPLVQYLVALGTIDQAQATALFGRATVFRALFGASDSADGLADALDKSGFVDHTELRNVGDRPADVVNATLASMVQDFKRNRASGSRATSIVGGAETDYLLEDGTEDA